MKLYQRKFMTASIPSENFTQQDIIDSTTRVQTAFDGEYGDHPIYEGGVPIGSITATDEKIAITFRGNRNNLWEVFYCFWIWKRRLTHVGFEGKVHAGIDRTFQRIREDILNTVKKILSAQRERSDRNITIVVEGHSRGAGIAILVAACLKREFPEHKVTVLTYSPMAIFDEEGARNYTAAIGEENHLAFVAEEDLFPHPLDRYTRFHHVGKEMKFSPTASLFYRRNVQRGYFPYLIRNYVVSKLVKLVLSVRNWNAHMLETYRDVAPTLIR